MTIYAVPEIETRRDALVERLFNATLGAFDLYAVHLGDRLGLYRALAHTSRRRRELARRPGSPSATPASGSSSRR